MGHQCHGSCGTILEQCWGNTLKQITMKKLIGIALMGLFLGGATVAQAQEETKQDVKKVAKKAGHKTASVASKGNAKVTDQRYKEKMGPNGENVYIDNRSRYYWVDKKGKRHYITSEQLKSRVD